jgi:hypothetical protein
MLTRAAQTLAMTPVYGRERLVGCEEGVEPGRLVPAAGLVALGMTLMRRPGASDCRDPMVLRGVSLEPRPTPERLAARGVETGGLLLLAAASCRAEHRVSAVPYGACLSAEQQGCTPPTGYVWGLTEQHSTAWPESGSSERAGDDASRD